MHRRTLTLRRFGPMSFGLGYFEDGIWVDHSAATTTEAVAEVAASPMEAVHQWYACCADSDESVPVIEVSGDSPIGDISPRLHVASSR